MLGVPRESDAILQMNASKDLSVLIQAHLECGAFSDELEHGRRMLALLAGRADCFERTCFPPGHFTASALVVSADGRQSLLTHHRFLDRWLQFGGHCDGNPDTLAGALREAEEESGIAGLKVVGKVPFDLDIHPIPANPKRGEPAHEHFDVRYLLSAPRDAVAILSDESHELRWFTTEEMEARTKADEGLGRLIMKWRAWQGEMGLVSHGAQSQ